MKKYGPATAVILAGCLWGVINLFVKTLSAAGLGSLQIALGRLTAAALIFSVFLLIRDPSSFRIRLKDIWMFIGTGVVSVVFFNLCYFYTMIRGQASIAVVLLYTSPVFVMLFSALLFGERITPRKTAALLLTVTGCVFVSGLIAGELSVTPLVLLSGIASGMLYALYTIFGRYALARYSTYTVTVYTFILAFIASIFFGDAPGLIRALHAEPTLILWILGLAVVSTVFPYFLYTWGLQHMESGKAAILVAVEPVVGAIIGMTVFREPHDLYKLIGIALIIAAIFVLNTGGESPDPEKT